LISAFTVSAAAHPVDGRVQPQGHQHLRVGGIPARVPLAGADGRQELFQVETLGDGPAHACRMVGRQQFLQAAGAQQDLAAVGFAQPQRGRREPRSCGGLGAGLAIGGWIQLTRPTGIS